MSREHGGWSLVSGETGEPIPAEMLKYFLAGQLAVIFQDYGKGERPGEEANHA